MFSLGLFTKSVCTSFTFWQPLIAITITTISASGIDALRFFTESHLVNRWQFTASILASEVAKASYRPSSSSTGKGFERGLPFCPQRSAIVHPSTLERKIFSSHLLSAPDMCALPSKLPGHFSRN